MAEREVRRCKHSGCNRATFVETDEGISADFRHGSSNHREVFTIEQMKVYLASRGYVVVEVSKIKIAA